MYHKQQRNNQNSSKSAHTPPTNQFVPSKFFLQPKQEERKPISAEEYEKIKASEGNYHDSSIVTNRPTHKPPTIQLKLKIGQIGDKYAQEADQVAQEVVQHIHAPETPSFQTKEQQEDQQIRLKPLVNRIQHQESEEKTPVKTPIDPLIQLKGNKPKPTQPTHRIPGATLWARDKKGNILPPSLDDIGQGGVNNCFFFAAMAAIVNKDPQLIVNMIQDNGNGTYTVTFKGIGFAHWRAKQTVTADFLVGKHGKVMDRKAFWPLIIEKAYAQQKGGIDAINNGGSPASAIKDMTNKKVGAFNPQKISVDDFMNILVQAKKNKQMITVSSPEEQKASREAIAIFNSERIPFNHAYTIIDVDPSQKRTKLFNPWGYRHPRGDGWMDIETVHKFFAEVMING
ncbi:MAG TPA: C2 family cysteine protease [Nostocaceae cyanobacterium]|nr:C2 family cysteine protease [Nostocaceae cyanobacterium]